MNGKTNNNTGYIRLHVTNAYMCTKNPCSGLLCRTLLASDCRPETVLMLLGHLRVVGLRPRVMAHPTQAGCLSKPHVDPEDSACRARKWLSGSLAPQHSASGADQDWLAGKLPAQHADQDWLSGLASRDCLSGKLPAQHAASRADQDW